MLDWKFNAWAKYDNWGRDDRVGTAVASITGLRREAPARGHGSWVALQELVDPRGLARLVLPFGEVGRVTGGAPAGG